MSSSASLGGYLLGLLVEAVSIPVRVDHLERVDNPVVLSQPHDVHRRQGRMLVHPPVAGPVAELALFHVRALVVSGIGRVGQKLAARVVETDVHPSGGPALRPEGGRFVGCRAVNLRTVDEGGDLVHLLSGAQAALGTDCRADKVQTRLLPVRVEWIIGRHENGKALRVRVALDWTALNHLAVFCSFFLVFFCFCFCFRFRFRFQKGKFDLVFELVS